MDEYLCEHTLVHLGFVRAPKIKVRICEVSAFIKFLAACESRQYREYYLCPERINIVEDNGFIIAIVTEATPEVFAHLVNEFPERMFAIKIATGYYEKIKCDYVFCWNKLTGHASTFIRTIDEKLLVAKKFVSKYDSENDSMDWELRRDT